MRSPDLHGSRRAQGAEIADGAERLLLVLLPHVAEYNKAWNYYKGLTEDQIEREIERDILGRRPTWPLGMRVGSMAGRFGAIDDGFGEANGFSGKTAGSGGKIPKSGAVRVRQNSARSRPCS